MKKIKYFILILVVSVVLTFTLNNNVMATSNIETEGIYSVTYIIGGQSGIGASMIKKYLKSEATIENINSNYYLSITTLSSSIENLSLIKDENKSVGLKILNDNDHNNVYRYTITYEDLNSELNFSVFVSVRKETYTFTITLDLNNVTLISSDVDEYTDRPALFVPTLSGDYSSSYELERGVTFNMPKCKAYFDGNEIKVIYTLFYNNGSNLEEVEIIDNKVMLSNVGSYILKISASTPEYKTLLGNDTNVFETINITATVSGSSFAKIKDYKTLRNDCYLIATKLTSNSDTYNIVSEKIKNISENYEVFDFKIVDPQGEEIILSDDIIISAKASDYFNRTKINVYHLKDDGNLTKVNSENGGRYVDITVSELGTYIILVPGVTFIMPIWGYILISIGSLLLILLIVTTLIILVKKRRKYANN